MHPFYFLWRGATHRHSLETNSSMNPNADLRLRSANRLPITPVVSVFPAAIAVRVFTLLRVITRTEPERVSRPGNDIHVVPFSPRL
jgi:hypothetical protein